MEAFPDYKRLRMWVDEYASAGIPDQKALEVFIECETDETIRLFRNEIMSVSKGNFNEETMDRILGKGRKAKHKTYEEWAQLALLWLSTAYRRS